MNRPTPDPITGTYDLVFPLYGSPEEQILQAWFSSLLATAGLTPFTLGQALTPPVPTNVILNFFNNRYPGMVDHRSVDYRVIAIDVSNGSQQWTWDFTLVNQIIVALGGTPLPTSGYSQRSAHCYVSREAFVQQMGPPPAALYR